MSKPTKRFVLVPADVFFNQEEERATNPGLMSITSPPESKKAKFSEQDLKQELIKQDCESPLELTTKASQLDVLDRLAPSNSKEKTEKNNLNINDKIQTVISKLIELGFSSSKLERSRIILQSFFKNSRLSLNELLEIQLDGSPTQLNLLTFLSDLQVANKKLGEASLNVLRVLKIATKHVIANVKAKEVVSAAGQSDSNPSSLSSYSTLWVESF